MSYPHPTIPHKVHPLLQAPPTTAVSLLQLMVNGNYPAVPSRSVLCASQSGQVCCSNVFIFLVRTLGETRKQSEPAHLRQNNVVR